MPLGSPACGNCKNVDCTSAPKCFDYNGYDFGNCTYKNDIPKAIAMGLTSVSCTIVAGNLGLGFPKIPANISCGQEEAVDKTVRRVLWNIFKGGVYDKVGDDMAWAELADGAKIGSQEHDEMNYEMALQVIQQLRSLRFQEACFEPELLSLRPALRPASSFSGGLADVCCRCYLAVAYPAEEREQRLAAGHEEADLPGRSDERRLPVPVGVRVGVRGLLLAFGLAEQGGELDELL